MKTFLFLLAAAFCWLGLCEAQEHYGQVIPAPEQVESRGQSTANAEGAVVELLYRRDVNAEVLALRQSSGERRYLYHRNPVGLYPVVPEITKSIHWLTPDSFACVASGCLKSYYTLYRLKPMEDAPGTMHAWKEAEGCCHFRLEWQVQDGQLIGCWQGKPYVTISPLSLLFDDRK